MGRDLKTIYIADFGLAKCHINKDGQVLEQRHNADFRGTVSFASLNAHNWVDLGRRDDLWSWFFILLDFYDVELKWRVEKNLSMEEVKDIKKMWLSDPDAYLWSDIIHEIPEIRLIFQHINKLSYADKPDYDYLIV